VGLVARAPEFEPSVFVCVGLVVRTHTKTTNDHVRMMVAPRDTDPTRNATRESDLRNNLPFAATQDNYCLRSYVIIRYVPSKIRTIATSFNATAFLSISSFRTFGRYFVIRIAKNKVNNGEIKPVVDTSVIGPSEAA
jgi:hypothetical protein